MSSWKHSYQNNYFSLIDIAATEERVLCTTQKLVCDMGFLDPSTDSKDLAVGTKMEFPMWLAKSMSNNKICTCSIPKIYREEYREILRANPSVVILSKWNHYYYEFGMYVSRLPGVDTETIIISLLETFRNRLQTIMDQAFNPVADRMIFTQLPALERELYLTGKKYYRELINWMEKGTKRIQTADVINAINLKKRKRLEMDLD